MTKKNFLYESIPYCIICLFLVFSIILIFFLRMGKLHTQEINLDSLPFSNEQCDITSISQENGIILIEGIYYAKDQYINSVNLSCVISNPNEPNNIGYLLATEFFEVCDEQTVDMMQRDMAGFRAIIDMSTENYSKGTYNILLLNRCNECNELIETENIVELGGYYIE